MDLLYDAQFNFDYNLIRNQLQQKHKKHNLTKITITNRLAFNFSEYKFDEKNIYFVVGLFKSKCTIIAVRCIITLRIRSFHCLSIYQFSRATYTQSFSRRKMLIERNSSRKQCCKYRCTDFSIRLYRIFDSKRANEYDRRILTMNLIFSTILFCFHSIQTN